MSNLIGTRPPPGWFRIAALLALLWNLIGVYFYLVHVRAVAGPAMSESDRALMDTMPALVTGAFAIGVFAGTLGCLGLLLRAGWARPLLLLSLLALIVTEGWYLFVSGVPAVVGPSTYPLPISILVIAVLLAWLAARARQRGWIG